MNDESIAQSEIGRILGPGENMLWTGRPRRGLALHAWDAFMFPFGLVFCGLAVFFVISDVAEGASPLSLLWEGVFVIAGLYLLLGRFIVDAQRRARTFYGVSNRRIIIISRLFGYKVQTFNPRTLEHLSITERSGGDGTISFAAISFFDPRWSTVLWIGASPLPAFEMIEHARSVYELIERTWTPQD
ncbi:hypothetical protein ACQP1O_18840 [Nocardia sp. CA-151230]|uniref:hypothetical protein n=1 Tax=Nocardia sp. CA-151230 TaxID=3239982 RepID=UPI003D8A2927